ncbi:MAG TPA: hypothetical protein VHM88_06635 [Candidatus Acidoferrales bacterium]|jgi:hypothetical protein|nr:hypothetical protein [Candidatus Acidoferrales bacterium]
MKTLVVVSIFTVLLLGGSMYSPRTAQAQLLAPNKSCTTTFFQTTSTSFVPLPEFVTIDNGASTQDVVIWFSSTTTGPMTGPNNPNLIFVDFLIDGIERTDLDGGTPFFALTFSRVYRSTGMWIVTLGPGVHTIQPQVASADGPQITLFSRCLLASNTD